MANRCQFWKEYNSADGTTISFCELAAFNKPVSTSFLAQIGCTEQKRKGCIGSTELNVSSGAPPALSLPAAANAPGDVAANFIGVSRSKASLSSPTMQILALLAGAYIAFGAILFTIITNDLAPILGDGLTRMIGGVSFALGLVMVVIGGAELFTGNSLIVTGFLEKKVSFNELLRNWTWVYIFNFIGSLLLVFLFLYSGIWKANGGAIGLRAINIANAKVSLSWSEAFFRGILCNWLVCMAVWLAAAGKDVVSKIAGIVIPISAFVASGFEHSIANMYFIPMGIALQGQEAMQAVLTSAPGITWGKFFVNNLIPVTIGNIIGGAFFVAFLYWTCYRRPLIQKSMADVGGKSFKA
jgi:formate/nitrite transporter